MGDLPPPLPNTRVGFRPHPGWRVGAWILAVVVAGIAARVGILLIRRYDEPVYRADGAQAVFVIVATVMVLGGAILLVRTGRPDAAVLALIAAVLVCAGVLALLSVGFLFLLIAAWPIVTLVRRIGRDAVGTRTALSGGLAIGVGLAVLLLMSPRPAVRCTQDGVTVSSSWRDAGTMSGIGHSDPDGTARGSVSFGSSSYVYECREGRLIEFREQ